MKLFRLFTAAAVLVSFVAGSALAQDDKAKKQAEIRKATTASLDKFYKAQPKLKEDVAKSPGYAVFTTYGLSFLVGGSGGHGMVYDPKTKKDTFMDMAQATAGLQIGASESDTLIIFKNEKALNQFIANGWEFGGAGGAQAGAGGKSVGPGGGENLVEGRFLCIRRANDISQDTSFVPSPQVNRHKDERFGTHHARDAWHLFHQLGHDLNLFSSSLKVNSQYMHAVHFNIKVKKPTSTEALLDAFKNDRRVALTYKNSANSVFSFGRDYGHYGRILNHAVMVAPTLMVRDRTEVVGFCFTPQDGNALISSVAASCWFVDPEGYEKKLACLRDSIFDEV